MRRLVCFVCVSLLMSVAEAGKGRGKSKVKHCNKPCNQKFQPLCGSNGETYSNLCRFNNAQCIAVKNGSTLSLKSRGPCANSDNYTQHAKVKNCSKMADCSPVNSTKYSVCGSDNITYSSFCYFRIARCQASKNNGIVLTVKYKGECGKPKANKDCPLESQCSNDGKPVCASDRKTYKNTCLFLVAKCKANRENKKLKPLHRGACGSAITPKACPKSCPNNNRPVCGSDGKTYTNGCHLAAARCKLPNKLKRKLRVQFNGRCDAPSTPKPCPTLQKCKQTRKLVCGTDGNTYLNTCRLRVAKCHAKRNKHKRIEVKHKGKCRKGNKGQGKGKGRKGKKKGKHGQKGRKNKREE